VLANSITALQSAGLAPTGDIRDQLATDIQADARRRQMSGGFMPSMKRFGLGMGMVICSLVVTLLCWCYRRDWVCVGMPPSSRRRCAGHDV